MAPLEEAKAPALLEEGAAPVPLEKVVATALLEDAKVPELLPKEEVEAPIYFEDYQDAGAT